MKFCWNWMESNSKRNQSAAADATNQIKFNLFSLRMRKVDLIGWLRLCCPREQSGLFFSLFSINPNNSMKLIVGWWKRRERKEPLFLRRTVCEWSNLSSLCFFVGYGPLLRQGLRQQKKQAARERDCGMAPFNQQSAIQFQFNQFKIKLFWFVNWVEWIECWVDWLTVLLPQQLIYWLLWVIGRRPIYRGTTPFHNQQLIVSFRLPCSSTNFFKEKTSAAASCENKWSKEMEWMKWELGWKPITHYSVIKKLCFLWRRQLSISLHSIICFIQKKT